MEDRHLRSAVDRLRQMAGDPAAEGVGDPELLEVFVGTRVEAAFALLVRRHGPLVLSVCRRVLRNDHDAEDAFQATFLLLARKAASIRRWNSLASWLYAVAYRVSLEAKGKRDRRLAKEAPTMGVARSNELIAEPAEAGSASAKTGDPPAWEVQEILKDEVNRLPEKYRAAVVLCYFQGQTNEEAAHVLGCPKGTVLSRLARP